MTPLKAEPDDELMETASNESLREDAENEAETSNTFLATDDLVRSLIEAVKHEEVLYKPGHKHFRHLIKKHQAYISVAKVLTSQGYADITSERVKQKWNTIKSVYWRHRPHCGNPCDPKSGSPGFVFCRELQFLDSYEFRFYRNRKSAKQKKLERDEEAPIKAGNATAIVSTSDNDDGMNRILHTLDSSTINQPHHLPATANAANTSTSANITLNDQSENSNQSEVQSITEFRVAESTSRQKRSCPPAASFDSEYQTKKMQLIDLELEHQRLLNEKATHNVRQARFEAELAEIRLTNERQHMKMNGSSN